MLYATVHCPSARDRARPSDGGALERESRRRARGRTRASHIYTNYTYHYENYENIIHVLYVPVRRAGGVDETAAVPRVNQFLKTCI